MSIRLAVALWCAAAVSAPKIARAEPEVAGLAEELARLRGELEVLDARLEEQRDDRRAQLRALASRRAAVELELQRETLRARQLAERAARDRDRRSATSSRREALVRAIAPITARLADDVRRGAPYRVEERAAAVAAIGRDLEAGTTAPGRALDALWTWIDAELALARRLGVSPQVVSLEGAEVMADVAHLGLVAAYARAPDGRVAVARRDGGGWRWSPLESPADRERTAALFAALREDVERGFFVLPGALVVGGAR